MENDEPDDGISVFISVLFLLGGLSLYGLLGGFAKLGFVPMIISTPLSLLVWLIIAVIDPIKYYNWKSCISTVVFCTTIFTMVIAIAMMTAITW